MLWIRLILNSVFPWWHLHTVFMLSLDESIRDIKVVYNYDTWFWLSVFLTYVEFPSHQAVSPLSTHGGKGKFRPWSLSCLTSEKLFSGCHESDLVGCVWWKASANPFDTHCRIPKGLITLLGRKQNLHHVSEALAESEIDCLMTFVWICVC